MIYYILAFIIVVIDQITKIIVLRTMELGQQIELIPNFLYFTSHRNSGAAWGILQGQMWLFYIVTVVMVAFIIYMIQTERNKNPRLVLGFAIILGGAIGNFIDRLLFQEVTDFIDVYIFGYNFPIFNVADMALTIGVILVIILILFDEVKLKRKKANGSD